VTGVRRDGGAVTGVATTTGVLDAEVVGNAVGAWAPVVDRMVGVEHPLRRTRSPIVRYETGDRDDWDLPFTLLANEHYLRRCPSGVYVYRHDTTYRLNGNVEPHPVTPSEAFRESVRWFLPDVVVTDWSFPAVNEWVGYRTITPDGSPLAEPTAVDGYLLACGMNGICVTFASVVGQLVAEWAEDGGVKEPFD